MTETLDLKQIEQKAWRSVFEDGIWDLYLGILLFLMGVSALLDTLSLTETQRIGIYIGLLCLNMVGLWAGKRFITLPRMGHVRFGAQRQQARRKTALVLFLSVVFGMVAFLVAAGVLGGTIDRSLPWDIIFPSVYALNMLLVFGLGAYFLQFNRLYLVAVLFALPVPLDYVVQKLLGVDLSYITFMVPGLVIIGIGAVLLARFVREHPVMKTGD